MVLDARRLSCDPCECHAVLSNAAPCTSSQDDLVQPLTHLFLAFKYVHLKQEYRICICLGQMLACPQTGHLAGVSQSWTGIRVDDTHRDTLARPFTFAPSETASKQ